MQDTIDEQGMSKIIVDVDSAPIDFAIAFMLGISSDDIYVYQSYVDTVEVTKNNNGITINFLPGWYGHVYLTLTNTNNGDSGRIDIYVNSNYVISQTENKIYRAIYEPFTREEAQQQAKSSTLSRDGIEMHGHLVEILNQTTQAIFESHFIKPDTELWTGAKRTNDTDFNWESGLPLLYSNWANSEPNNYNDIEDAVVIREDGKWNDITSQHSRGYIVEYDINLDSSSFSPSYYKRFDQKVTWDQAKKSAEFLSFEKDGITYKGHLATISSQIEQDFIAGNFLQSDNLWIGYYFNQVHWTLPEQSHLNSVNHEPVQYTNWASGEPSLFDDFNLYPAETVIEMKSDNTWNNVSDDNVNDYVVEFEPQALINPSNQNQYYAFYGDYSWDDAYSYTKQFNPTINDDGLVIRHHLATIESLDEQSFIENHFTWPGLQLWLGGKRDRLATDPYIFNWITNEAFNNSIKEPFNYTNWNDLEPNDAGGTEDAVIMFDSGKWNDLTPSRIRDGFIVEVGTDSVPTYYNDANGHCYLVMKTPATWDEAREAANNITYSLNGVDYEGRLLFLNSQEELTFIETSLPQAFNGNRDYYGGWGYWIGGVEEGDNHFLWYGHSRDHFVEFTNWADSEPSNDSASDAIHFWGNPHDSSNAPSTWNDADRSTVRGGYVVELVPTKEGVAEEIVYNPINRHVYKYVDTQIYYSEANTIANQSTYIDENGQLYKGHLVCITSATEQQFINDTFTINDSAWTGLIRPIYQDFSGFHYLPWEWKSGESVNYSNWDTGEPTSNNTQIYLSLEPWGSIKSNGKWNDVTDAAQCSYIVEYIPVGVISKYDINNHRLKRGETLQIDLLNHFVYADESQQIPYNQDVTYTIQNAHPETINATLTDNHILTLSLRTDETVSGLENIQIEVTAETLNGLSQTLTFQVIPDSIIKNGIYNSRGCS